VVDERAETKKTGEAWSLRVTTRPTYPYHDAVFGILVVARNRTGQALIRQWALVQALADAARGRTTGQLTSLLDTSRATLHHDINALGEAGIRIAAEPVAGQVRYRLVGAKLSTLRPTFSQMAAVALLRTLAAPLQGTALVQELDSLLLRMTRVAMRDDKASAGRPATPATRKSRTVLKRRRISRSVS
jgi:predicted DNA-binding transcriptional regulator YafY